jgi:hypothetical protein
MKRRHDERERSTARSHRWWHRRGRRHEDPMRQQDVEPAHDQPWVPTSGLADKVRRSPRQ